MKHVVLCSSGIRSAVLLASVVHEYGDINTEVLWINYGQKNYYQEFEHVKLLCEYYGVDLFRIAIIPPFDEFSNNKLCLPFLFSAFAVCRASPYGKVYIGLEHNTLWSKKTAGGIEIETPLSGLSLEDVIKLGDELGVPFHLTYSCDLGDRYHCGTCSSCKRRKKAFSNLNMEDSVTYEV